MVSVVKYLVLPFILLQIANGSSAKNITSFEDLRGEVVNIKAEQNQDILSDVEQVNSKITACPPVDPERPFVIVKLGNKEFTYATIPTGTDTHCFYLVDPLNRALTVEEARDFLAAIRIGIPSDDRNPAMTLEQSRDGEAKFKSLRNVVSANALKPPAQSLSARDSSAVPSLSPSLTQALATHIVDCSEIPVAALAAYPGMESAQFIYNASYYWKEINLAGNGICYYITSPLNRGLSLEEAYDFTAAKSNDMAPPRELEEEG